MKAEFSHERDSNSRINPTAPAITTTPPPPQPSTHHHLSQTQTNMFSKFPPKFETPSIHHPHPQYHHHHHHFHLTKDPQTSEETDSNTATPTPTPSNPPLKKQRSSTTTTNEEGETVEVVRRPRGRPPGSKNKPKPPVIIPQPEPSPSMSPHILEIPGGLDIIDSLTRLTRRRAMGLCILTASGSVANVSLRQPGGVALTFHGRFEMLSLSALLLPVALGNLSVLNERNDHQQQPQVNGVFTISLAGPQGQIVGGKVVGPLVTVGTVYVVAASFSNPTYHRLAADGEEDSGGERQQQQQQQQISESSAGVSGEEVGGNGMYNTGCHDVIWAPTARPPPQHQRGPQPPY